MSISPIARQDNTYVAGKTQKDLEKQYQILADSLVGLEKEKKESLGDAMNTCFTQEIPICGAFMAAIHGTGSLLRKTSLPGKFKSGWAAKSFSGSWPFINFNRQVYNDTFAIYKSKIETEKEILEKLKDPNSFKQSWKNRSLYKVAKGVELPPEIRGSVLNLTGDGYKSARELQIKINEDVANNKLGGKALERQNRKLQNLITKCHNKQLISQEYDEARRILSRIKSGNLKGEALAREFDNYDKAIRKADINVNKMRETGQIRVTSKFGKAKHWVKKKTGVYKLKGRVLNTRSGSKVLRYASKGLKGNALFAVIAAALEIPNLISANKLDKEKKAQGIQSNHLSKQVKKSTIKTVASVGGFAAGSALGSAAAGAAFGSAVPGIGTVVGFVCGLVVGAVASHYANKYTNCDVSEKEENDRLMKKADSRKIVKEMKESDDAVDKVLLATSKSNDENIKKVAEEIMEERNKELLSGDKYNAGSINYLDDKSISKPYDYGKELAALSYLKAISSNPFSPNMFSAN